MIISAPQHTQLATNLDPHPGFAPVQQSFQTCFACERPYGVCYDHLCPKCWTEVLHKEFTSQTRDIAPLLISPWSQSDFFEVLENIRTKLHRQRVLSFANQQGKLIDDHLETLRSLIHAFRDYLNDHAAGVFGHFDPPLDFATFAEEINLVKQYAPYLNYD